MATENQAGLVAVLEAALKPSLNELCRQSAGLSESQNSLLAVLATLNELLAGIEAKVPTVDLGAYNQKLQETKQRISHIRTLQEDVGERVRWMRKVIAAAERKEEKKQ